MEETLLERAATGIAKFLVNILGGIITWSITFAFLYFVGYIVLRYLICGNDKEEFSMVSQQMRSGCKDIAASFKNVMPGVAESAKFWSEERIAKISGLRGKKAGNGKRKQHHGSQT